MDLTQEIYDEIIREISEKRREIADEEPPNETQEWMTEGVLVGLDIAQAIVQKAFGR